ncbi:uncharacterized protein [Apostichopus japonicus]|uniref:uncharacterized protein n=1 Tax=Stichopus japonicus TaxID=307972 RepID=UPI003AB50728
MAASHGGRVSCLSCQFGYFIAIIFFGLLSTCKTQQVDNFDSVTTSVYSDGMCTFNVSEDSISNLNETLEEGNFFIYLNLKFPEPFSGPNAYLEEDTNIINPLTWVFAARGKGNLLLALPFDFIQLSMGTLLPGVDDLTVTIETDPECFQDRNESDVLQELAEMIFTFSSMASQESDDFSICIERQLTQSELDKTLSFFLPGSSYILFQTSTIYDCWASIGNDVIRESPVVLSKYRSLIYSVYFIGIILALYSPLAGLFFVRIRPSPPIAETNENTIAIHADLPLGFKYNVMFSGNDNRWVRLLRWIVIILLFGIIPYIPYITWAATGQLGRRMAVIDQAGVLSYAEIYGLHLLIEFAYYITIASILVFTFESYDKFTERMRVQEVDRVYFCLVELEEELQIPQSVEIDNSIPERRIYGFFEAMMFRSFGIVNSGLYTYFFGSPYVWLHDKLLGRHLAPGVIATTITTILYLIALPVIFIYFVFSMTFYAIPLGDILLFLFRKCYSNNIDAREVLTGIGIVLLAISMFFKIIAVFVYIGELIGFTFVGFLLHTETVGEYVMVGVLFAGILLNAITGYYDSYCTLLHRVFQLAEARDARIQKDTQTIAGTSDGNLTFNKLVFSNDQGVPFIKVDLFERVIKKYQPIKTEIFKILAQFFFIGLFVLLGLSIIKTIDGFSDIPATVEFFATVIVAGVLPVLVLVLRSPGKTECLDDSKWRQLETDLDCYVIDGKFEKDFLQY